MTEEINYVHCYVNKNKVVDDNDDCCDIVEDKDNNFSKTDNRIRLQ